MNEESHDASVLSNSDLDKEGKWLEFSVRNMIGKPAFRATDLQVLTPKEMQEFKACDEAYRETALIHILRRVQQLPRSEPRVQQHVKRILHCISKIEPSDGLSPWVMLTTPLYTAGCEALGSDREVVRDLHHHMFELLRIRNIERPLQLLEMKWARDLDDENGLLRKQSRLSPTCEQILNSSKGQADWDFIPY
jgi:hypothetical protein